MSGRAVAATPGRVRSIHRIGRPLGAVVGYVGETRRARHALRDAIDGYEDPVRLSVHVSVPIPPRGGLDIPCYFGAGPPRRPGVASWRAVLA